VTDKAKEPAAASSGTSLTLLQRIRQGDPDGWGRVVDLYSPLVRYWCRRWGVHGQDADDLLQEVFSPAARSIGSFRREQEGDSFRSWLRALTRNKILGHWRTRGRQPEAAGGSEALQRFAEIEASDPGEDSEEASHFSQLVEHALKMIRDEFEQRTWQAFWQVSVDGRSPADVAAGLEMSANAVRMAKSRVLRRLREELGDLVQ
jgi:RNA polymerase sigma-70 factor (ECF subfamily)